jgi:hypothetical protein
MSFATSTFDLSFHYLIPTDQYSNFLFLSQEARLQLISPFSAIPSMPKYTMAAQVGTIISCIRDSHYDTT